VSPKRAKNNRTGGTKKLEKGKESTPGQKRGKIRKTDTTKAWIPKIHGRETPY